MAVEGGTRWPGIPIDTSGQVAATPAAKLCAASPRGRDLGHGRPRLVACCRVAANSGWQEMAVWRAGEWMGYLLHDAARRSGDVEDDRRLLGVDQPSPSNGSTWVAITGVLGLLVVAILAAIVLVGFVVWFLFGGGGGF